MSEKIGKYIDYLKSTSKFFSVPDGMYKCLIKERKKESSTVIIPDSIVKVRGEDFFEIKINNDKKRNETINICQKEHDKKIFIGLGSIMGVVNRKKVFGCIFYCPVLISDDFNTLLFNPKDLIINTSLMSAILPDYISHESNSESEIFYSQLDELYNDINRIKFKYDFGTVVDNIIKIIACNFDNINMQKLKSEYVEMAINNSDIIEKGDLTYSSDFFVFLSRVPSEISTYDAISNMSKMIEDNKFSHSAMENLFKNIFEKSTGENEDIDVKNAKKIIERIPLDLTSRQAKGIENALTEKVSYIQGPPGTGKSYTISAIVLAAFLSNKKILIVSQKNTALNVLKNNILNFFSKDISLPFIYFDKKNKKQLKDDMRGALGQFDYKENTYMKMKENINKRIQIIEEKEKNILKYKQEIDIIKDKTHEFYIQSKQFEDKSAKFFNDPTYKVKNVSFLNLKRENHDLKTVVGNLEKVFEKNKKFNRYQAKIIKEINYYINENAMKGVNIVDFIKKNIAYRFINEFIDVNETFNYLEKEKKEIKLYQEKLEDLYYRMKNDEVELKKLRENNIKETHAYNQFYKYSETDNKREIDNFIKMINMTKDNKIKDKMNSVNFEKILSCFPIWLSEISNIGEVLPMEKEIFDLVVVDEASQVNLAEIIPVFYRAKNICVVGDHCQLGISSVGTNFILRKKTDQLIWEEIFKRDMTYNEAKDKKLLITDSSVIELINSDENNINFPTVMLNEHWRCLPELISFSNKKYYNNELKIMTETPDKILQKSACAIKVDGVKKNKTNEIEAEKVIDIIDYLIGKTDNQEIKEMIDLNDFILDKKQKGELSIGVLSLIRDQVDIIKDMIFERYSKEDIEKYGIYCGTAEDYQGEEKDVMIHSFVVDGKTRNSGHYSNEKRFNVAVSRAKYYTILVYSDVSKISIFREYLQHFNLLEIDKDNYINEKWGFNFDKMDSIFERNVYNVLSSEIEKIERSKNISNIIFFNQVESMSYKLDFVIYNKINKKSIAIEIDGKHHFKENTKDHTERHIGRIKLLEKAGWKIINTAYFSWYERGIFDIHGKGKNELDRIIKEIRDCLDF